MDKVRRIGVVTVTYNSAEVLPEFLDCIARQTYQDFILYVVDNASKDKSVEIASDFADPCIRILANAENLGVAEGNNQGIRAALADGCDAVLLLNNDTAFPAEMFAQLRDGLVQHDCSMTTPKIYYHDRPHVLWAAGGYFQPHLGYRIQHYGDSQPDTGQFDMPRSVTYTPTCCVLIHKNVFDRIGLMDSLYFVYVDDVDFMYRALRAGYSIQYLPDCKLWHKVGSLTGNVSNFSIRYCTRNRAYFLCKHFSGIYAGAWNALYWSYQFARHILGKDSRDVWKLKSQAMREGVAMAK